VNADNVHFLTPQRPIKLCGTHLRYAGANPKARPLETGDITGPYFGVDQGDGRLARSSASHKFCFGGNFFAQCFARASFGHTCGVRASPARFIDGRQRMVRRRRFLGPQTSETGPREKAFVAQAPRQARPSSWTKPAAVVINRSGLCHQLRISPAPARSCRAFLRQRAEIDT